MLAALTGAGLSAAAGLNAYIPFLLVALLARFSDIIELPSSFAWIESWWAIGLSALLLVSEVVLDKIPVIDHANDTIGTFIRPTTGGLIFAATQSAENLDNSQFMMDNPWIGVLIGVVTSGFVHATKATARPVVNATTLGVGAPVVSTAEDGASVGISLIAIFLPILVILVLVGLIVLAWWVFTRGRRMKKRYDGFGERVGIAEPRGRAHGSGSTRL